MTSSYFQPFADSTVLVHRPELADLSLFEIRDQCAEKMAARRRIGPMDWSADSIDMRDAMTRAVRAFYRVAGHRVTRQEAGAL